MALYICKFFLRESQFLQEERFGECIKILSNREPINRFAKSDRLGFGVLFWGCIVCMGNFLLDLYMHKYLFFVYFLIRFYAFLPIFFANCWPKIISVLFWFASWRRMTLHCLYKCCSQPHFHAISFWIFFTSFLSLSDLYAFSLCKRRRTIIKENLCDKISIKSFMYF